VSLIKTLRIPANSSVNIFVQTSCVQGLVFLEPLDSLDPSLQIVESPVEVKKDGSTVVEITNTEKLTHQLKSGTKFRQVAEARLVGKSQNTPKVVKKCQI